MGSHTKTGLLLLMIYVIISLISGIVAYSLLYSVDYTTVDTTNFSAFTTIIPIIIIAFVGGVIGFIGAIFMLLGRKEFGEKHQKFIFYAMLIFVITIVVMIIATVVVAFLTYSYVSSMMPGDSTNSTNFMNSTVISIMIIALISVVVTNLIWVFGLYQLENSTGRICLFLYYIFSIAMTTIIYVSMIRTGIVPSTGIGTSSYSQWGGNTGLISFLGSILPNIFLFVSIYNPYQRISSGELIPIAPAESSAAADRMCPNCGRSIPFDARICPYCSKKFEEFP
ncbi:MAG: zinc ribbon domain-containing protein [Methanobacteriota archaeon]